jgi:branched-chain amino acid transport system ATP-binding protein
MRTVLQVDRLTKRYGGLAAVDGLSFSLEEGETLGIAGPNGAGKTTLFDLISGHARATSGTVKCRGREIQRMPAHQIRRMGIARTYQVAPVFPSQSVLSHVALAAKFGRERSPQMSLRFDDGVLEKAAAAAERVGLGEKLGERGELLSSLDRKRLMLAAALVTEPDVLMLDEPVGGLTDDEMQQIVQLISELKKAGLSILLVEHVMRVLMPASTRVLVMHQGAKLFEGLPAAAQADPDVIRLYLGAAREQEQVEETAADHA